MRSPRLRVRRREGFSLIEMLIAIVVMGILLVITAPRVRDAVTIWNVRSARAAVANLYARARVTALQRRTPTTLRFDGDKAYVTVPLGAGMDTVGTVTDLHKEYGGISVTQSSNVTVTATGLVNALAPITIKVALSGRSDSVMISGYGRIQ